MKRILILLLATAVITLTSCGGGNDSNNTKKDSLKKVEQTKSDIEDLEVENEPNHEGIDLLSFITAPQYGWKKADEEFFYSFFKDGRLSIQGADGEATMWEGKWSLDGDELTIKHPEKGTKKVKISVSGKDLMIDGVKYIVYTI